MEKFGLDYVSPDDVLDSVTGSFVKQPLPGLVLLLMKRQAAIEPLNRFLFLLQLLIQIARVIHENANELLKHVRIAKKLSPDLLAEPHDLEQVLGLQEFHGHQKGRGDDHLNIEPFEVPLLPIQMTKQRDPPDLSLVLLHVLVVDLLLREFFDLFFEQVDLDLESHDLLLVLLRSVQVFSQARVLLLNVQVVLVHRVDFGNAHCFDFIILFLQIIVFLEQVLVVVR